MNVLVLNSNYTPLGVTSWQKAITLYFSGKVEIIQDYPDKLIRSVSLTMNMPAVIRVLKWIKSKKVGIRFNKRNIYIRDNGKCCYCNRFVSETRATFDHVVPKSRGGLTNWTNIVTACYNCNQAKDCRTPEEAGLTLHHTPSKPDRLQLDLAFSLKYQNNIPEMWKQWIVNTRMPE